VAVMYDGEIVAKLSGDAITEEAIVAASLNVGTQSSLPAAGAQHG